MHRFWSSPHEEVRTDFWGLRLDPVDQILFDLPIMQKIGNHVQVEVKSLRRYEDFAADVKDRLGRLSGSRLTKVATSWRGHSTSRRIF